MFFFTPYLIKQKLFVAIILMLCAAKAFAQHSLPITVVTEIAPPLQFFNGDQLDGSTTKKVKSLLRKAGLEAEFKVFPWARAFKLAQQQQNTLIYPMVRTPEREEQFIWLGKLLSFKISVIVVEPSISNLDSLNEVKQLSLGLMRNDYVHQLFQSEGFIEGEHYQLSSDLTQLISLLYSGKITAMVADLPLLKVMALALGYSPESLKAIYDLPGQEVDVYLAASKNTSPTLVKKLRHHISGPK